MTPTVTGDRVTLAAMTAELGLEPDDYLAVYDHEQAAYATSSGTTLGLPAIWAHDGRENDGQFGYRCPTCRDARFLIRPQAVEHPDYGTAYSCRCQHEPGEARARAMAERLERSGLEGTLLTQTLDTLRWGRGMQEALAATKAFEAWLSTGGPGLSVAFMGDTGRGKTHLLAALIRAALVTCEALYADTREFIAAARAWGDVDGVQREYAHAEWWITKAIAAPVLALDEFGSVTDDWARTTLERILLARWTHERPTLLALTCTAKQLARWSPRITSRLQDSALVRIVELSGPDYRKSRGVEAA